MTTLSATQDIPSHTALPAAAAVVPAGGVGLRMGLDFPKQFALLAGKPILQHTVAALHDSQFFQHIVVAAPAAYLQQTQQLCAAVSDDIRVVIGGGTRQQSVRAGFAVLEGTAVELVAVHDGARPLLSRTLLAAVLAAGARQGAAIVAVPVTDTLKRVADGLVAGTTNRENLWQAQTPQVIRQDILRRALARADADNFVGTDEASLLEHAAIPVAVVPGEERNIKITRPDDLELARLLLEGAGGRPVKEGEMRIGHGYDAHRLVPGRPLVLGGETIPHPVGLAGHSDADVLTHALCDAILGAMGQGDIGRHFPDSDPAYAGADSLELLRTVVGMAGRRRLRIVNCDLTIIAQQPKLAPHFAAMRENLAAVLEVAAERINLKGTTTEKMGFAGREEGIAAHAVVLLAGREG